MIGDSPKKKNLSQKSLKWRVVGNSICNSAWPGAHLKLAAKQCYQVLKQNTFENYNNMLSKDNLFKPVSEEYDF